MGISEQEIILYDDCSTDDTWEALVELEREYPDSVIIIHSDVNGKPGTARNVGLTYATAPYIAFIDGDDWVEPDYLKKLYDKMAEFDCDIVACGWWRDFGDGKKLESRQKPEEIFIEIDSLEKRKDFFVSGLLGTMAWSKLIRKEYLAENQIFFPEGILYEDNVFVTLNYLHGNRFYILEESLYHYFVNPESVILKKDQWYYRDLFETNYIKWEQFLIRGALETMKWEAEFDFLVSYYLQILKLFSRRYTEIPPEAFEEMQQFILANIPDYHKNPYIKTNLHPAVGKLFSFISQKLGETELRQLHSVIGRLRM